VKQIDSLRRQALAERRPEDERRAAGEHAVPPAS
jgi:hypothetical protein